MSDQERFEMGEEEYAEVSEARMKFRGFAYA